MSVLDDNIQKAQAYIARFRERGVLNHIGGDIVPALSGETMETISPVDGSILAQVAKSGAEDVDRAAAAAKAAFPTWSKTPGPSGGRS